MTTNLNTLQARARKIVERSIIATADEIPEIVQRVRENGKIDFILPEKLIKDIADEMQRLEMETYQRYTAQSRSISTNSNHDKNN